MSDRFKDREAAFKQARTRLISASTEYDRDIDRLKHKLVERMGAFLDDQRLPAPVREAATEVKQRADAFTARKITLVGDTAIFVVTQIQQAQTTALEEIGDIMKRKPRATGGFAEQAEQVMALSAAYFDAGADLIELQRRLLVSFVDGEAVNLRMVFDEARIAIASRLGERIAEATLEVLAGAFSAFMAGVLKDMYEAIAKRRDPLKYIEPGPEARLFELRELLREQVEAIEAAVEKIRKEPGFS